MSRSSSSRMRRPTQAELLTRIDDDRAGVKYVKECETGSVTPLNPVISRVCVLGCIAVPQCFLPAAGSNPVKSILFSESSDSLVWAENGRFHFFDKHSGNTSRSPRTRLRWTIKCMVREVINGKEYLWTGHANGEVCLWSEFGKLIGKPFTVAKTAITAMCLVQPKVLWVGAFSGNVRVLKLDTSSEPFEIRFHTTVVPGLETTSRILTVRPWIRPMRSGPSLGSIENIPEGLAVGVGTERSSAVVPSGNSFPARVGRRAQGALQWGARAHSSLVRCIFAKGGRVWTAGGRMRSSIKIWNETNHHLESVFTLHPRGPCVSMVSIPWQSGQSSTGVGLSDWRLLTAHETGLMYLWDPAPNKPFRPLLEIETRKSPIKSLVVYEKLGLMCTAHKDGSVLVGRLLSHQMRIHGLSAARAEDDDQIFPFVPRTLCEDVFPGGLQCAIRGPDCLFIVSNRGEILYWPKEKLQSDFNILKRSSSRRMDLNDSVMAINRNEVSVGETIYDGDFARVKRGKFLAKDVIVKEAKDSVSRRAMDALVKDAHILSTVRHPNIVNIMAVCDDPPFVVMQYYEEGSLYEVLKRCNSDPRVARRFTWEKRLTVAIDICCGMIFLHHQSPPILHRDLKSPNVFVEKDFTGAAVGDFNLSKDTGPTFVSGAVRPSNPMWQAPEVARGAADFSIAADIYAFGILLWEIATFQAPWDHLKTAPGMGREIFFGKIRYELFENRHPQLLRNDKGEVTNFSGGEFSQTGAYVQLMQECWAGNPDDRPESFAAVVGQLEHIKKEHLEWKARNLGRHSAGAKKNTPSTDLATNPVKRTVSEPEGVLKTRPVINNEPLPPLPHSPQTTQPVSEIPQSPFDRQGSEDDKAAVQGDPGSQFPVSPFN